MTYQLATIHGDSLAVPQLVVSNLQRADGDAVRVALYLLSTGCTDPKTIAHALGLKSVSAASHALLWWAGVGLLEKSTGAAPAPQTSNERSADAIDLSTLTDPFVGVLCEETQATFGKSLGRHDLQKLVALYLNDGWLPDVILLCCSEVVRQSKRTVGAVERELQKWREAGVETGEDAERYLRRESQRSDWCKAAAALFGLAAPELTQWERRAIVRWHEDWHFSDAMLEEAVVHAESHRTVRYVDGILRNWHAQGLTAVQDVRGKGALTGANLLATSKRPAQSATLSPNQTGWTAVVDDDKEW